MSVLVGLENISLAYGLEPLLDHVKLQIHAGERVCLIGRNGAGKSSLLKIIEGSLQPDTGSVRRKPTLRLARLAQELPHSDTLTVYEYAALGLAETGKLLNAYHALTLKIAVSHTEQDLLQLERLQQQIDANNGWQIEQHIQSVLTRLELNPDQPLNQLSGGWQRRAALAKALAAMPELLLLDEPTNHLDIEAIQWLEEQLLASRTALVFITHDRALLKRLATRIIELDRGHLTSWPGDYENFLRCKEAMLHAEAKQNAEFDKKLAQEERWIRQGIKARRTRNEGRVRSLEAMRLARSKRREIQEKANFQLTEAEKSGQLVIEAAHLTHHFQQKIIIKDFSIRIQRGDRIGLIGPNGAGKSTLLNILLGRLSPEQGTVKQGTKCEIAYFDEMRQALDPQKTVIENVAEGKETVEVNGKQIHIISYLADFLFSPARAMTPVKALSGGECNRLLLARLFRQPANLLIMDEPTNDLDIETLELLEELLVQFQGTLLLVSHDRAFLDNVVTSTLVFEGEGHIQEYIGGYQDWLKQRKPLAEKNAAEKKSPAIKTTSETKSTAKKLTYSEQKELATLPQIIDELEKNHKQILDKMSTAEFYQEAPETVTDTLQQLKSIEKKLAEAYERWEILEERRNE